MTTLWVRHVCGTDMLIDARDYDANLHAPHDPASVPPPVATRPRDGLVVQHERVASDAPASGLPEDPQAGLPPVLAPTAVLDGAEVVAAQQPGPVANRAMKAAPRFGRAPAK